jgi:hypothetical protein
MGVFLAKFISGILASILVNILVSIVVSILIGTFKIIFVGVSLAFLKKPSLAFFDAFLQQILPV